MTCPDLACPILREHDVSEHRTLDEAWKAAERAHRAIRSSGFPLSVTSNEPLMNDYTAAAGMEDASGPTPVTALNRLATLLNERKAGQ